MITSFKELKSVIEFLVKNHIPYMIIGGLANAVWGQVRATRDADFKVSIGDMSLVQFRHLVTQRFPERQISVPAHLKISHVIHVWAGPGIAVDFLVSIFDYERQAIERALSNEIEGVRIRVCTAEDLIIHKAVADREQDWVDIEGVLIRQAGKLDQEYVTEWLAQFAEALESHTILERYRKLQKRYDLR